MKNLLVLPLLLLAACGDDKIDSHKEGIEASNDVADDMVKILGTIKDKKSAEAAKPKLEALGKKMEDIQQQMEKLGQPDAKTAEQMMGAMSKVMEAMMKLPNDPEVHQVLGDMR